MKDKDIRRSREEYQDAGAPEDRRNQRAGKIPVLRREVGILNAGLKRVKKEWRGWEVALGREKPPEDAIPCGSPDDGYQSRRNRKYGSLALLLEVGLTAWMVLTMGVPMLYGILTALGLPFLLHAVVYYLLFDHNPRPKQGERILGRWLIKPGGVGIGIGFGSALLARAIAGPLAFTLLPVFSIALWLLNVSLVAMAVGYFCAALVRGKSLRFARTYEELEKEEQDTEAFLRELERDEAAERLLPEVSSSETSRAETPRIRAEQLSLLAEIPPTRNGSEPALPPASGAARAGISPAGALLIIVTLSTLSATACSPPSPAVAASTTISSASAAQKADAKISPKCEIGLDFSGSLLGLESAWSHVEAELPDIIAGHGCTRLAVWSFAQDGWMAEQLMELDLPAPPYVDTALPNIEWIQLKNIRESIQEVTKRKLQEAQHRYHQELVSAMQRLTDVRLPAPETESPGSDIVGSLRRISLLQDSRRILLITDGADTRYKTRLPPVPTPQGDVRVLILLTPSKPEDTKLTLGKDLLADEQFEIRSRALKAAAPWAAVIPFFVTRLSDRLARDKRSTPAG